MASSASSCYHLVAVPYPGRGHINPMLNLCKNLIQRMDSNLSITFVLTEEWLSLVSSDPDPPPGIRYVTIPNVIPSELVRAQDMASFLTAVQSDMAAPFDKLLKEMVQQPPDMILADWFLPWSVEIGRRSNIPVVLFWPMSATVLSMYAHLDLLKQNGHFPIDLQEMADVRVDYIPGLNPCPVYAFPTMMYGKGLALLDYCLEPFKVVSKAQCILLCSVFDLEPHAVEALKCEFQMTVYSVGPSFPHFRLREMVRTDRADDQAGVDWLNKQEPRSVLYVSFGSFCANSVEQMDELAAGLVQSGVKFMWVARGDAPRLGKLCGDSGLVVPWCDQLLVLSHIAVGGFLTHCGWSSTQEGLFTGVPFLTFPLQMDQETNSKMIVEDFKVGWRVKGPTGADDVVKRDEISRIVKRFMDSESGDVNELRLRAEELRNRCVRAVNDTEGSYEVNFSGFMDFILSSKEQKQ